MTAINNELVLVGGWGLGDNSTNKLCAWRGETWMHPYPEMPTRRANCSAIVYNKWLVLAGGSRESILLSVDVMKTETKVWFAGPPTPTPWDSMKTAIIGDIMLFYGWQK